MRERLGKLKTIKNYLTIQKRLPKVFPNWCKIYPDIGEGSGRVIMPDKRIRLVTEGCFLPFADHLEMNGRVSAHIVSYLIDQNQHFEIFLHSVYPNFRLKPIATEGSYAHNFQDWSMVKVDDKLAEEKVRFVDILGKLTFINATKAGVEIRRTLFPAVFTTALIEKIEIENLSDSDKKVEILIPRGEYISLSKYSLEGDEYISKIGLADSDGKMMEGFDEYNQDIIKPEETKTFYVVYYTRKKQDDILVDCLFEEKKRNEFIQNIINGIRIETPDHLYNTAFTHAVIRGSEAVFETKAGLMTSPGGGAYYGAIWTNDNVEYSAPFFGYSGLDLPINATLNVLRLFKEEIDASSKLTLKKYGVPASITNCGDNVWDLVGDRGDTQMYASGLTKFLLAVGDKTLAEEFWDAIDFCVNYTKSRTDKLGRVKSDTDELEGRFPSGKYNLSTNCLAYEAYLYTSFLSGAIGSTANMYKYFNLASKQRSSIIKNFTSTVEGYKTYKYYNGNKVLRSWISMPMNVGIKDNAQDTIKALFSPKMYSDGYLKTASNRKTTWDRSLLFAFRGALRVGEQDEIFDFIREYTSNRLIGFHAPYPVEAYPEGNMRQLSAESILYARVFTEGMFGLTITGFGKFSITPAIPTNWKKVALRHLVLANMPIDIVIEENNLKVLDKSGVVIKECNVVNGQKVDIDLFA